MKGLLTNLLFYFSVCEPPSSVCDARDDAMKSGSSYKKSLMRTKSKGSPVESLTLDIGCHSEILYAWQAMCATSTAE